MTSMALTVESGEVQELREQLRDAHLCRDAAEEKLAAAERVLARGESLVADAQAAIQKDDEAAKRVAEAEAERIVAEAQGLRVALPDDSAGARAGSKHAAEQRLADAGRAVGLLRAQRDLAKRDLTAAMGNVDAAACLLLFECGERLAVEMVAAEVMALDLRMMLAGLAGLWVAQDGKPGRVRLGVQAVQALNNLPRNDDRRPRQGPANISPHAAQAEQWRKTLARLRENPEADLPAIMGDD